MATADSSNRRTLVIVLGVLLVAVVGGVLWFLGGDAPSSVDIDEAADAVDAGGTDEADDGDAAAEEGADDPASEDPATDDDTGEADADEDAATDAPADQGVDGTWVVDTSIGEFSVLDTTGTFVGFRIAEELANIGATEAVGRTPGVTGELVIADDVLTAATFTGDLTLVESDRSRRDDRIQTALDTATFPTATFALTGEVPVDGLADGAVVEVVAPGTLTVRDVEQPVEVPLQATLRDGVAVVTGSFEIAFADYGVTVPTAPIVLSVADVGDVEFQLYLTRG